MFCRSCGKELKDDSLFCSNCGTAVKRPSATPAEAQDRAIDGKTQAMRHPADEAVASDMTQSTTPTDNVMPPRRRMMIHLAYTALVFGIVAFVVAMAWLVVNRMGDDQQSDVRSMSSQAADASVSGEAASGSDVSTGASDAGSDALQRAGNEAAEAPADSDAAREAARKQAVEEFAQLYIGTCTVVDAATGETEQIANRYARIMEYVEPGSLLEAELNAKPRDGDGFMSSVAVAVHSCSANSVYGNTVVVAVSQSATQGNAPNWLQETNVLMLHCTFADDGLISEVKQDGIVKMTGSVS